MTDHSSRRPADFPMSVELATRFDDLDTQKHVNNVAIANLYQEGRVLFHRQALGDEQWQVKRSTDWSTVLADIRIQYRRETHYPAPVVIGSGLSRLGNSSYTIHSAMFQEGQCVGICDAVLVHLKGGKPERIGGELRALLARFCLPGAED